MDSPGILHINLTIKISISMMSFFSYEMGSKKGIWKAFFFFDREIDMKCARSVYLSLLTANTSEALITTEDISDKNKIKNDLKNTTNNNQNLNNDVERVRKNAINVENQLKEIRKSMHLRYQNG